MWQRICYNACGTALLVHNCVTTRVAQYARNGTEKCNHVYD